MTKITNCPVLEPYFFFFFIQNHENIKRLEFNRSLLTLSLASYLTMLLEKYSRLLDSAFWTTFKWFILCFQLQDSAQNLGVVSLNKKLPKVCRSVKNTLSQKCKNSCFFQSLLYLGNQWILLMVAALLLWSQVQNLVVHCMQFFQRILLHIYANVAYISNSLAALYCSDVLWRSTPTWCYFSSK